MKKFSAIVLTIVMICAAFTGCGASEPDVNYAPEISNNAAEISGFALNEVVSAVAQAISEKDETYVSGYWMPYCEEILDNAYTKSEDESLLYDYRCYANSIPQLENVSTCYQEGMHNFSNVTEEGQSIIKDIMDIYNAYYPDFDVKNVIVETFRVEGEDYEISIDSYLAEIESGYLLLAFDGGLDENGSSDSVLRPDVSVDADGYVDAYIGDAIHLFSYSKSSASFNPCYDYVDDAYDDNVLRYIVCWKNANEMIPKIDKNALVGITDANDEISLLPINGESPTYAVPVNFANNVTREQDDVYSLPDFIDVKSDIDGTDLKNQLKQSTECNGQNLKTFINANSDYFVYRGGTMGGPLWECYKLLIGEKNQEFTFGGYFGTNWEEMSAVACLEYYKIPENKNENTFQKVKTEKTKNGYFKVDLSGLDSGIYYVSTYDTFIELV